MLLFLLFLMICRPHKLYCPIRLKGIVRSSINCCFSIFSVIESSGGDNPTPLCTCVLYFLCCIFPCYIFFVVLKSLHSLQQLLMLSVWNIFGHNLKRTVFYELSNLGLLHYLVIFLCLFKNDLSVSKLNCLLLFLLLLLISNISVVL